MADTASPRRKLLWIAVGGAATFALRASCGSPWGMYVYAGVGVLVSAIWFWNDRSADKGERWDIAVALPFMALLWPVLALALPFMKHFRAGT